jgi:hypothetical protein
MPENAMQGYKQIEACPKQSGRLIKEHMLIPKTLVVGQPEADVEVFAEVLFAQNLKFHGETGADLVTGYMGMTSLEALLMEGRDVVFMRLVTWSVALRSSEASSRAKEMRRLVAASSVTKKVLEGSDYSARVVVAAQIQKENGELHKLIKFGWPSAVHPTILQSRLTEEQRICLPSALEEGGDQARKTWEFWEEKASLPFVSKNEDVKGYEADLKRLSRCCAFGAASVQGIAGLPGCLNSTTLDARYAHAGGPEFCVTQAGAVIYDELKALSGPQVRLTCFVFGQMEEFSIMGRFPDATAGVLVIDVALTLPFKVRWMTMFQRRSGGPEWHPTREDVFMTMRRYVTPSLASAVFMFCTEQDQTKDDVHRRLFHPDDGLAYATSAVQELWRKARDFGNEHREILDECSLLIAGRSGAIRLLERKVASSQRASAARGFPGGRGEDLLRDNLCAHIECSRGSHQRGKSSRTYWGDGSPVALPSGFHVREGGAPALGVSSVVHLDYTGRPVVPEVAEGDSEHSRVAQEFLAQLSANPGDGSEPMEEGDPEGTVGQPSQPHLEPSHSRDGSGVSSVSDPPPGDAQSVDLSSDLVGEDNRPSDWATQAEEEEEERMLLGGLLDEVGGLQLEGASGPGMMTPELFAGLPPGEGQGVAQDAVDDRPPAGGGGEGPPSGVLSSQTPPPGQLEGQRDSDIECTSVDTEEDGGGGSSQEGQGQGRRRSRQSSKRSPSAVTGSPGTRRSSRTKPGSSASGRG